MNNSEIKLDIDNLQESIDKYYKLFLVNYPQVFYQEEFRMGSIEMNELALECQAYISILGKTIKTRMEYIGFNELFPFNNEVDWYNWRIWVTENKVEIGCYLSIFTRIYTELRNINFFLKKDKWGVYRDLEKDEYLNGSSCKSFQVLSVELAEPCLSLEVINTTKTNSFPENVEEKTFPKLDTIEKKTSIMANIATFLARIFQLRIF